MQCENFHLWHPVSVLYLWEPGITNSGENCLKNLECTGKLACIVPFTNEMPNFCPYFLLNLVPKSSLYFKLV